MTWKVEHNSDLDVIETIITGYLSASDARASTSKVISLGQELGIIKFLVDASKHEQTENIVEIWDLPQQYADEGADRNSRLAYVRPISPNMQKIAQFYVDVCVNRGWHVESFSTRKDAIRWLLQG